MMFGNQCSPLQEMVTNGLEDTEALMKAVKEKDPRNDNKDENERKQYDADSAEMQTLDGEIKKHAEHDQN